MNEVKGLIDVVSKALAFQLQVKQQELFPREKLGFSVLECLTEPRV